MKLETFFEKFDVFADAPDAVGKMRELVLDLAVRGRLFGKAVEAEANGLPNGWHERQLGDVAQFINGDRSKNYPSKSFRVDDGVPFINAGHLYNGDVDLTDMDYITPEHFDRLGGGKVEPGDVLYCLRGSLGKCAVVQSIKRGAIASSLLIIRPSQQIASRFIYLFLTSPLGARMIAKYDNGSAQPNLSAANVKKYIVPLPPLAEQKRIVAKVDELMALCDQLEAQQQERETRKSVLVRASLARFAEAPTPANLGFLFHKSYDIPSAELRKSILTLAVQGKLVPQDATDEPAEVLLDKISQRKKTLIQDKLVPKSSSLPAGTKDVPFALPNNWQWIRLESICEVITKGSSPNWQGVQYVDAADGVLFITSENVGNYVLRKMDEPKYVERKFNEMETRSILQRDDLLVNLVGASIGRSAVFDRDDVANINQAVGLIRLVRGNTAVDRRYILHYLNSPTSLEIMFDEQVETARANLSLTNMKHFLVPIPPLAEQRRIVAKVDQLMALVDELERQQESSHTTASKLLDAIVHELTNRN